MTDELRCGIRVADLTLLCSAAKAAWDIASPRARRVRFSWRGRKYASTLTTFRMLVTTDKGEPVACRWH
jgi:hypothetical protein